MKQKISYNELREFLFSEEKSVGNGQLSQENAVERVKRALNSIPEADFSRIIEQRAKTIINVNSLNPLKARAAMARPEFAQACAAKVVPLRKTIANGISLYIEDPDYGKPVIVRIRRGGMLMRGMGNEAALVSIVENAIQSGATTIVFKDDAHGSIAVKNVVAVRRVGNDAGSRMGNRADIEITDEAGTAHRFSIKNTNFSAIAKVRRFFANQRLKIQRSLRAFAMENGMEIPHRGLLSVPVKNAQLFKFCWFGNDIDANGGVVEGDFEKNPSTSVDEASNAVAIKCKRVFSPNDDVKKLMSDESTCGWLIAKVTNKAWHLEIIGVYNDDMGKRYALPGFEIDGVTNQKIAENQCWGAMES